MVRETRYLLVRNLPEKCTEETVNNHFQRYGKIQSVKLHLNKENDAGPAATIAFMDIKSASKAQGAENLLENCSLRTEYCEGSTTGSIVTRTREPDRGTFHVPTSSTARGSGTFPWQKGTEEEPPTPAETTFEKPPSVFNNDQHYRGRPRERIFGAGKFVHGKHTDRAGTYSGRQVRPQVDGYGAEKEGYDRTARATSPSHSQSSSRQGESSAKLKSVSISRSPSQSRSRSTRSRSRSSSSGSWSSRSSRSRSRSRSRGSSHGSRLQGSVTVGGGGKLSSAESKDSQAVDKQKSDDQSSNGERKPLGICVTGLPLRSSDTSLRDGLFHEYKKHGKVTSVQVVGESADRYAVVSFRRPEDASKALEASQDKMFFGTRIKVIQHEGVEVDDADLRPSETELDEYHPKATRTLFVGNLEKDTGVAELIEIFKDFGEIIDVDIKRQGAASAYAFVQYADITSVVKALRQMEGEHIGANKIKLGFGKSMPTNCIWLDNVSESVSESSLFGMFSRYGEVKHDVIDRTKGRALIYFSSLDDAQYAVNEMRGRTLWNKKIQIDFASRECQNKFLDKMDKTGQLRPGEWPDERGGRMRRTFDGTETFTEENSSRSFSSTTQFSKKNYFRGSRTSRGRSSTFSERGGRGEGFQEEFASRRQRSADGFTQGRGGDYYKGDDSYEQELRDYGQSQRQRERGHSSPRRVEDRYEDRPSRRSSRDVSLDSYDERSKDRMDIYRSESPGSDRNSYRSESRYRSRSDDKSYSRDRFDLEKHRDYEGRSDPSRSQSPVSFHSPASPSRRKDDELSNPSYTPPTPTEEEPPMYGYYPNDYSRKSQRSNSVHRHVSVDDSLSKPQPWSVVSVTPGKPQSEIVKPPEKLFSRKRSYEEAMLHKDLAKVSKKLDRSESSTLKSTASKISVTKAFLSDKLRLDKSDKTRVLPKTFMEGQVSESPGSTHSHAESENGSESDLLELHSQKALLLQKLQQLGENAEIDPSLSEDVRNVVTRRLDGSKLLKGSKLDERKLELVEEIKKIDSSKSYRKQMEKLRILETKVATEDSAHRKKSSSTVPVITRLDDSENEDVHIESPTDISASFRQHAKRRKFDVKDGDLSSKVRSYRRSDKCLSSDDELTEKTSKKKDSLDMYSKNLKLHDGLNKLDTGFSGYFALSKSPRHDILTPLELADRGEKKTVSLPIIIKEESETTLEDPRIKKHLSAFDDRISSSAAGKEISPHVVPADSSTHSPKEDQLTFVIHNSPEYPKSPRTVEEASHDVSEHSPKDINLSTKTWTRPIPYESGPLSPVDDSQDKLVSDIGVVDSTCVMSGKVENSPSSVAVDIAVDQDDCFSDSSLEEPKTPGELSLEERIRILDEKMSMPMPNKPMDSQSMGASVTASSPMNSSVYSKYRIKKKQDAAASMTFNSGEEKKSEPSDIVKQLMSRRSKSILDQDSKRLEQINEKYEPKDVTVTLANSPPKSLPQIQTKAAVKQMPVASMGLMGTFGLDVSSQFQQQTQMHTQIMHQQTSLVPPLVPASASPLHSHTPPLISEASMSSHPHHPPPLILSQASSIQTSSNQQLLASTSAVHSQLSPTVSNLQLSSPSDSQGQGLSPSHATTVQSGFLTSFHQSPKHHPIPPETSPRPQLNSVSPVRDNKVIDQTAGHASQIVNSVNTSCESVSSSSLVASCPQTSSTTVTPNKDTSRLTAPVMKRRPSDSVTTSATSSHPTEPMETSPSTTSASRLDSTSSCSSQSITSPVVTPQETKKEQTFPTPAKIEHHSSAKKESAQSKEDKEKEHKHIAAPVLMRSKSSDERAPKSSKMTSQSKSFEMVDKKPESEKKKDTSHRSHESHSQHSSHKDKAESKKDVDDKHHHKTSSSSSTDKKVSKSHSQDKEHKEDKKHDSSSHKDKVRHDSGSKSKTHKEVDSASKDKMKAKHKDSENKKDGKEHSSDKMKSRDKSHDEKKHEREKKSDEKKLDEKKHEEKKDDKKHDEKKEEKKVEEKKEDKKHEERKDKKGEEKKEDKKADERKEEKKVEEKKSEKKDKAKVKETKPEKIKQSSHSDTKTEKSSSKSQEKTQSDHKDTKKSTSSTKEKTAKDSKDSKDTKDAKDVKKKSRESENKAEKTEKSSSKSGSKNDKKSETSKEKSESKSKEKHEKKEEKKEKKEKKPAAVNDKKLFNELQDIYEPYVSMYDKVKRRSIEKIKETENEDVRKCFDRFTKSRKQKNKFANDSDSSLYDSEEDSAASESQNSEAEEPEPPKDKGRKKKTQIIESSSDSDELQEYIKQKRKKKSKTTAQKKTRKLLDISSDSDNEMDTSFQDEPVAKPSKKTSKKRKSRDDWSDEDIDEHEGNKVEKRLEDRSFVDAFPSEVSVTEAETMDEAEKKTDSLKTEKQKKSKVKKPKEGNTSKSKKKEPEKPTIEEEEEEEEVIQLEDLIRKGEAELRQMEANAKKAEEVKEKQAEAMKEKKLEDVRTERMEVRENKIENKIEETKEKKLDEKDKKPDDKKKNKNEKQKIAKESKAKAEEKMEVQPHETKEDKKTKAKADDKTQKHKKIEIKQESKPEETKSSENKMDTKFESWNVKAKVEEKEKPKNKADLKQNDKHASSLDSVTEDSFSAENKSDDSEHPSKPKVMKTEVKEKKAKAKSKKTKVEQSSDIEPDPNKQSPVLFTSVVRDPEKNIFSEMHKLSDFVNKDSSNDVSIQEQVVENKQSSQEEDSDKELGPPKAKKAKKKKKKKDVKTKESKMEVEELPLRLTEKTLFSRFCQKSTKPDVPDITELAKETYQFDVTQDAMLEKPDVRPFSSKKDGSLFGKNKLKSPTNSEKSKDEVHEFKKDVKKDVSKSLSVKDETESKDIFKEQVKKEVPDEPVKKSHEAKSDSLLKLQTVENKTDLNETQESSKLDSFEFDDVESTPKSETKKTKKSNKKEKAPKHEKQKKVNKKDKVQSESIEAPAEVKEVEPKVAEIEVPKDDDVFDQITALKPSSSPRDLKSLDTSTSSADDAKKSSSGDNTKSTYSFQSSSKSSEPDEYIFDESTDALVKALKHQLK